MTKRRNFTLNLCCICCQAPPRDEAADEGPDDEEEEEEDEDEEEGESERRLSGELAHGKEDPGAGEGEGFGRGSVRPPPLPGTVRCSIDWMELRNWVWCMARRTLSLGRGRDLAGTLCGRCHSLER
jgi:hypothetical protein